jgi:hypothetical protein
MVGQIGLVLQVPGCLRREQRDQERKRRFVIENQQIVTSSKQIWIAVPAIRVLDKGVKSKDIRSDCSIAAGIDLSTGQVLTPVST